MDISSAMPVFPRLAYSIFYAWQFIALVSSSHFLLYLNYCKLQGRFSEVYSCSKASASIGGIGMGPYAIKIVSKNKKEKSSKNGEGGGDVEMVSRCIQYKCKPVGHLVSECLQSVCVGSLLSCSCTEHVECLWIGYLYM